MSTVSYQMGWQSQAHMHSSFPSLRVSSSPLGITRRRMQRWDLCRWVRHLPRDLFLFLVIIKIICTDVEYMYAFNKESETGVLLTLCWIFSIRRFSVSAICSKQCSFTLHCMTFYSEKEIWFQNNNPNIRLLCVPRDSPNQTKSSCCFYKRKFQNISW